MKVFEKNKILQYGDELVQQYDPVYRDPVPRNFLDFRSHFLAPRKYFAGRYFDTYGFNLVVIWSMSLVLYVMLYFEALKNLGKGFQWVSGWARGLFKKVRKKSIH